MANTVTDIQRRDYGRPQFNQVIFTKEELQVWQECVKNSSIIIPALLSTAGGYGFCKLTQFHTKAKYVAVVTGILGLVSSRINTANRCLNKVASMPGSNLRERFTEAHLYYNNKANQASLYYKGFQPLDVQSEVPTTEEPYTKIVFDDYPPMQETYDTYSSLNDSSDSYTSSQETDLTEPINLPKKSANYDELRHKNREEFYNKNRQWYAAREERSTRASEATQQPTRSQEPSNNAPSMQQKNKYGDVWS